MIPLMVVDGSNSRILSWENETRSAKGLLIPFSRACITEGR